MEQRAVRFPVNRAGSHEICERVERFLTQEGLNPREASRARLTMETLLRRIGEHAGREATAELTLRRRMGRACVRIEYPGAAFDPTLAGRESPGDAWSAELLTDLGLVPEWSWRRNRNCLLLRPRRREWGAWAFHLAALALAALCALFLPTEWMLKLERLVLVPVSDVFCGVIGVFAPPALFLALLDVCCGAGETVLAGGAGRRAVGRFAARSLIWALLGTAVAALLLPTELSAFAGDASLRLGGLLRAGAAREAPTPLGIAWQAAAVAAALLFLGGRAGRARECAGQLAVVFRTILEALCRLSPLLVFASALRLPLRAPKELLTGLWKPLAIFAAAGLLIAAAKLLLVWALRRLPLLELIKRLAPSAWAALSTASPAAAFGTVMDDCEIRLGLPHPLVLLALPTGGVLCVPAAALCAPMAALYVAASFGTALDVPALLGMALTGILLAVALPRGPGANLIGFLLLLAQLGLPSEGLAVMAVLGIFLDGLSAAVSAFYLQLELVMQSNLGKR